MCHHRNMSSATNLQFLLDYSDSSCVNSRPLFLLKQRKDIPGIRCSHLFRIGFNRWDYRANMSHRGRIDSVPSTDISLCDALVAYLFSTLNSLCELVEQQFSPWYWQYFSEKVRQADLCVFPDYSSGATCDGLSDNVVNNTVILLPELQLWNRSILVHLFIVAKQIRRSVNGYTEYSEFLL